MNANSILMTNVKVATSILSLTLLTACGGGGDERSSNSGSSNSYSSSNTSAGDNNSDEKGEVSIATGSVTYPIKTDNTDNAPTLRLNGANPQTVALGSSFINQGATANDDVDGNLSSSITERNNVDTSIAGCYQQNYEVSDSSGNSKSLTRTIFVGTDSQRHSPNSPPITQEVAITNTYTSATTLNLLNDAYDEDCDTLTLTNISEPTVGTATINSNGTVTYNSLGNVGSYYFTYTVSDNYGSSSTSGVSIASVDPDDGNDYWPQVSGETVTTTKNNAIIIDVLANDYDDDGDTLILDTVDTPAHGTIQKQNGKVLYTPDLNYVGQDSFYYGVHDDHGHNGSGLTIINITE